MKKFFTVSIGSLLALFTLAILACVFIPYCDERPLRVAQHSSCANNLRQLMVLGTAYAAANKAEWPSAKGDAFWLALTKPPPILALDELEVLICPVRGEPVIGDCDYRGPRVPYSSLKAKDPLAADKVGNHGEGQAINVLLKDGSVVEARPGDSLWKLSEEKLSP